MSICCNIIKQIEREDCLTIFEQEGILKAKETLVKLRNKFYYHQRQATKKGVAFTASKVADEHIAKMLYRLMHRVISGTIHYSLFKRVVNDYVSFEKFEPEIIASIRPFMGFFAFWREGKR